MKKLIWLIPILTFLWAIMSFSYWHIWSGIIFLLASIVALPIPFESEPTKYNNFKREVTQGPMWVPYIILMLIGVPFAPKNEKEVPPAPQQLDQVVLTPPQPAIEVIDSAAFKKVKVDSILSTNGIPIHQSDQPIPKKTKKRRSKNQNNLVSNNSITSSRSVTTRSRSQGRTYYTGRRGGCYYLSGSGKKVYVDRSYCY